MSHDNSLFPETDPSESKQADNEPSDGWDATMALLRSKFPKASDGILFCVHKLQQDPYLTLRDFRAEANLHGITLGGRSLHSAKVLLGMQKPAVRRKRIEADDDDRRDELEHHHSHDLDDGSSVEDKLIAAVQRIQEEATRESTRLRAAIKETIEVLQRALAGDKSNG